MHDLTQGSITRHLIRLAVPIAAGMIFQTLYYLVDLYFVARLGDAAIAGVSAAGNVQFIIMALTQVLGIGTMVLIAHATGRKDRADANLVFNQSLLMAAACAVAVLLGGYLLAGRYMAGLGADAATASAGTIYLHWFLPGLGLQFALVSMGSGLRGTGIVKPTMVVQMATVLLNAILAPILIAGWLTGRPMGVAGAGLASSIAILAGVLMLLAYFLRLEKYVGFDPAMFRARREVWGRILRVGLPPGGEFALMFIFIAVIYWIIRDFGAAAQAGYGIGSRVMQAIFLPAMALAFATAPLAGQNIGAGHPARAWEAFRKAAVLGSVLMLSLTLLCQWQPGWFIARFTTEAEVITVGEDFLRIISWNFVASGIVFTCSGMFQALGNTLPSLISGVSRLVTFVIPAVWLSTRPGFAIRHVWYLSMVTVALQALTSLWLLRRELRKRTSAGPVPQAVAVS